MQISMSDSIYENISDIFKFTSAISDKYSNKVFSNISSSISLLKNFPYIGRYVPEISNKNFRERICGTFRIVYYISEIKNNIYVRCIFSGRQNSNLFFETYRSDFLHFLSNL